MIAAALLLLAAAELGDLVGYPQAAAYGPLPREVRVLIDRRLNCDHWAGEEPYDGARKRQINRALHTLRCDGVEKTDQKLRRRYADQPNILRALEESRDWQ